MNAAAEELSGWTQRRFWWVVMALCVVQAGLITLFGEREHGITRPVRGPGHFRLLGNDLTADQLSKIFFATDPTVFTLPSLHGFSERAWLHLPEQTYEAPGEKEAPACLALDASRLGEDISPLTRAESFLPFSLADQRGPELEPWPVFLAPETLRTQSRFEIQGELAGRQLDAPADLPSWPSPQLLTNSVVQIAVDSAGQVIASRLLTRSRLAEADSKALELTRRLRFKPVASPVPVWGKAVFEWQTLEPTNTAPALEP
jgi:hypothetical protein